MLGNTLRQANLSNQILVKASCLGGLRCLSNFSHFTSCYVWDDIIHQCSLDPAVFNRTARILHNACNRATGGPPVDCFNDLVRLCKQHQDFEALQKLTDILETTGMSWDVNTHRYLLEMHQYADRYQTQHYRLTSQHTASAPRKSSQEIK